MKTFFKLLIALLLIGAVGGYIYWQNNKKKIIKDSIKNALRKKTDSLYFIHYDSSMIDEINGNASFYNVTLQSDSAQKKMLAGTDSLPNALFAISVKEVTARGVDMVGLLQKHNVAAKRILLNKPIIQITNTGIDKPKPFTYNDTLELYERMLGKFESIRADTISIVDGTLLVTDIKGKPLTTLENINVTLHNFLVDSTRDYQNIVSYFIKDVKVTVENVQLPESKNGSRINITKVVYDAPQKLLQVGSVQQYAAGNTTPVVDIKKVQITQLNTDAFILHQQLKAGLITCEGGLVTIYKKKKKKVSGVEAIELSSEIIDEAQIEGIQLGNTKIVIIDQTKPKEPALVINDVKFSASKIINVTDGSTISEIINSAEWELSAGGFSFLTREKLYNFIASQIQVNNRDGTVKIKQIKLQPLLAEAQFANKVKLQMDRYDLTFNNISLQGVNFARLVNDNTLEVENAALQPIIKIYNDRTQPAGNSTKVPLYPQQSILKLAFPFYIKEMTVKNGAVYYKEKGEESKMDGTPYFVSLNASIYNITNLPAKIKTNSILRLKADTKFLGIANLSTEWLLPLNPLDTVFKINGKLGPIDALQLNQITEPMAMMSVKSGKINSMVFNLVCNNYKGTGNATLLYNDLKVEVLKLKDDELKKRGLLSILANTLIQNNNPRNNNTYVAEIAFDRNRYSGFFNLVWKCILDGAKKTAMRK